MRGQSRTLKNVVKGWRAKTTCGKKAPMKSRDWARPVWTKTEAGNAYFLSWLNDRWKAIRTDWWVTVTVTHFPRLSRCLPGSSWITLTPFSPLRRIRGCQRLTPEHLFQQHRVFERDRLRPISTSATADFVFGQFRRRPISTSANF